jgi:outer membrane protein TolC
MKYTLTLLIIFSANLLLAQTDLETFLKSVENNNLKLKSFKALTEAQKLDAKTGLTPENPEVEYEHRPGNVPAMGTMTSMKVSQKLDFPTVYAQKNKLSKLQQEQAEREFQAERLSILGEAAELFIQRIYLQKYGRLYSERFKNAASLLQSFEQKLAVGDASVLEVNKLKLELAQARKQVSMIDIEREKNKQQLQLALGGETVSFRSDEYPLLNVLNTDELAQLYRDKDPELQIVAGLVAISRQETKLRQNENLPGLAFSYGYEKTPDVKYAGPGAAVTIPLWQNKNRVHHARSNQEYAQARLSAETQSLETELREKAGQLIVLKSGLEEMRQTLNSVNSVELLGKALNAGEISLIDYLTEIQYFYHAREELLNLEHNYYQLATQLERIKW